MTKKTKLYRVSEIFGITHEDMVATGAFDSFLTVDSRLHIDPYLLQSAQTQELSGSYGRFKNYFEDVLHLLDNSRIGDDRLYRATVRKLTFPELPYVALGYSVGHTIGRGIGPTLARRLTQTAKEIIDAGIKDPVIFELAGLFEVGIGADRISDMTIHVILTDILKFTERVATKLGIKTYDTTARKETIKLPYALATGKPVILIPQEILRDLPTANDWTEIDKVTTYNEELRERLNAIIGITWRDVTRRLRKSEIKDILLRNPSLLWELIELYKSKEIRRYDFERDPAGEVIWYDIAAEYAENYPLHLIERTVTTENIVEIVTKICNHFSVLIEDNGLCQLLYDDSGKLRNERFAQLLFYGIADAYCAANDLDLSREANAGRGSVDFKISRGYKNRVNVEVKYSSNNQLPHGYEKQLPVYDRAERAFHSIYLIIQTTDSYYSIDYINRLRNKQLQLGKQAPDIVMADGRIKPSASNV